MAINVLYIERVRDNVFYYNDIHVYGHMLA